VSAWFLPLEVSRAEGLSCRMVRYFRSNEGLRGGTWGSDLTRPLSSMYGVQARLTACMISWYMASATPGSSDSTMTLIIGSVPDAAPGPRRYP